MQMWALGVSSMVHAESVEVDADGMGVEVRMPPNAVYVLQLGLTAAHKSTLPWQ